MAEYKEQKAKQSQHAKIQLVSYECRRQTRKIEQNEK
jgi:hypothetical protein